MWRLVHGQSTETRLSNTTLDNIPVNLSPSKSRTRRRQPPEKPFCSAPCSLRLNEAEINEDYGNAGTQQKKLKNPKMDSHTEIASNSHGSVPYIAYGDRIYNQQQHELTDQEVAPLTHIFNPSQELLVNQQNEVQNNVRKLKSQKETYTKKTKDKLRKNNELLNEVQYKQEEMELVEKVRDLRLKNHLLIGELRDLHIDLQTIRAENRFKMEKKVGSLKDELKKEHETSNQLHIQVTTLEKVIDEMEISAEKEIQQMQSQLNNSIANMYSMKQMNMELVEEYKNLQMYVDELQVTNRKLQKRQDKIIIDMSKIISSMQNELQELKRKIPAQSVPEHDKDKTFIENEDAIHKFSQNIPKEREILNSKATDSANVVFFGDDGKQLGYVHTDDNIKYHSLTDEDNKQLDSKPTDDPSHLESQQSDNDEKQLDSEPTDDNVKRDLSTGKSQQSKGDKQLHSESTDPSTGEPRQSEDDKQLSSESKGQNPNQITSAIESQNNDDNQLDTEIIDGKENPDTSKGELKKTENYDKTNKATESTWLQKLESNIESQNGNNAKTNGKPEMVDNPTTKTEHEIYRKESAMSEFDDYPVTESKAENLEVHTSQDTEPPVLKSTVASPIETAYENKEEIKLGVIETKDSHTSLNTLLEYERRPRKITFSDAVIKSQLQNISLVDTKFKKLEGELKSCICNHKNQASESCLDDKNLVLKEQNGQDINKHPAHTNQDKFLYEETPFSQKTSENNDTETVALQTKLLNEREGSVAPQEKVNLAVKIPKGYSMNTPIILQPTFDRVKSCPQKISQQDITLLNIQMMEKTCSCLKKTTDTSNFTSSKTVLTNNCRCPYKHTQSGIKFTTKPINEIRKRSLNNPEVLGQTNTNEITENYLIPQETKSKTINILFLKSRQENKPSCKCLTLLDVIPIPAGNNPQSMTHKTMSTSPEPIADQEHTTSNTSNISYQYIDERKCDCTLNKSNRLQSLSNAVNETPEDCRYLMSAVVRTVLRLTASLAALQNKCHTKDYMIESLADELNIRSASGVFENLLTNLSLNESESHHQPQDFDRIGLCEYLKKPPAYVQHPCYQHSCIPPCPIKDKYPKISAYQYPENYLQFPCRGSCSKRQNTDEFHQASNLNPSYDDPCKAPCSKKQRVEDLKISQIPCKTECEATCSKFSASKNINNSMQPCDELCQAPCKKISQKGGLKEFKKNDNMAPSLHVSSTAPYSKLFTGNSSKNMRFSKVMTPQFNIPSLVLCPNNFKHDISKRYKSSCNAPYCTYNNICQAPYSRNTKVKEIRNIKSSILPYEDHCDSPCRENFKRANLTMTKSSIPPCNPVCVSSCVDRGARGNDNPFSDCIPSYETPAADHASKSEDQNILVTKDPSSTPEASNSNKMEKHDLTLNSKKKEYSDASSSSGTLCQAPCAQKGLFPDINVPPPTDLEVIHLRSIKAVLISWRPPTVDGLRGYEVYMDGSMVKKVSRHRTTTLLRCIECFCDIIIKVYTITRITRSFDAATYP